MRKVAPYGTIPPWRANPLRIAPIPCSRTPKWKLRPPGGAPGGDSPPAPVRGPAGRRRAARPPPPGGGGGEGAKISAPPSPPFALEPFPPGDRFPEMRKDVVRHVEMGLLRPSQSFLGQRNLRLPQRRAVGFRRVLLVGAPERNVGPNDDQRWTLPLGE